MSEQELAERLDEIAQLPFGRAKIAAVEEVLRQIDAQGSPRLQYVGRLLATGAYQHSGEPAKAFVTFSWCIAAYDRGEGDEEHDHQLFWAFKWIVSSLTLFPEVPLDRTYAVLDDMERRYQLAGHTMNPVHQYRETVAQHVGDVETADEQYRLWCAAPRGEMSDCDGCEPSSKASYLAWRGRDEDAIALAEPVLSGELTCIQQPQGILVELLLPYLRTGRLDEAADAHRRAYRAIQGNASKLSRLAEHLQFCVASGNQARGVELIERHLGWLEEQPTPYADMDFSASAAAVLRQVADDGFAELTIKRGAGEVGIAALRDELTERALVLAARFDARNGTSEQGNRVRAVLATAPIVEHLPLSGPVRRAAPEVVPAPAPIDLPDSAAELADLAERAAQLWNFAEADAIWAHFDEVDPDPALAGRRLNAQAGMQSRREPELAEQTWRESIAAYEAAGDELGKQTPIGRAALLRCHLGELEEGFAELAASVAKVDELGTAKQRAWAHLRLLGGLQVAHRVDDFAGEVAKIRQLVNEVDEPLLAAQAAMASAEVTGVRADAERAVELYRGFGRSDVLCEAVLLSARLRASEGDLDAAYELLSEALTATELAIRGRAGHLRGQIALDLERPDEAYQALVGAVAALTVADQVVPAAFAGVDLAAACLATKRLNEVADAAEDALPVLINLGADAELARARFLLARAYQQLRQPEEALELLDQVADFCATDNNQAGVGQMREISAEILDELDRDADAAKRFADAADAFGADEMLLEQLGCLRRTALSWLWAQEPERAVSALNGAEQLASVVPDQEPQAIWALAILGYDAARILANTGSPAEALVRVQPAAERFRQLEATTEATIADILRGRLLLDMGRHLEAQRVLTAALKALPEDAQGPREDLTELLSRVVVS
jgi:tetratricopeptide (TPR) repeat protein